jgi:hypothetical protein
MRSSARYTSTIRLRSASAKFRSRSMGICATGAVKAIRPDEIQNFNLSPAAKRAVFEAHGEIFTVPTEKGDVRD